MSNANPASTLRALLLKVASTKAGTAGTENVPPSSHPTDKLDGGNAPVPTGPYATNQKPLVAESAQANPIDGSPLKDGKGEAEHGIGRMMSGESSGVTIKPDNDDPKKMASLTMDQLLEHHSRIAVPLAAELVVKAASGEGDQTANTATNASTPAATPANTPAETPAVKAAKAGVAAARNQVAAQIVEDTKKQAQLAADLFATFHKQSSEVRKEIMRKSANAAAAMPVAPPGAEAGGPPMPPEAGGGGPPMPPEAGGGEDPLAALGGGGGAEGAAPGGAAGGAEGGGAGGDVSNIPPEQLEQLILALLEQTGSADPSAMEKSADPGAQQMAKAARAYMEEGRFEIRPAKNAAERTKINEMKKFIRETTTIR